MPSWSSGFVGACYGELKNMRDAIEYVKSYCYVDTLDLVKVAKFKRTCIIRGVKRSTENNIRLILIYADIYGIVNEICTKYHINRLEILPELYDTIIEIPHRLGLYGEIYVDSEIGERLSVNKRRTVKISDSAEPVEIAKFVASLPELCQCSEADEKYRTFTLGEESVRVEFYDFKKDLYDKAMSIVRVKLSGNSHEVS